MAVTTAGRRLIIHAITVAALTLLYAVLSVVSFSAPDAGPESGVGVLLALLPLAVLGLPWSCAFWANPYAFDDVSRLGHELVTVGPAWVNLAVHAVVYLVRAARSLGPPKPSADPTGMGK
jgi:hypothetical protein